MDCYEQAAFAAPQTTRYPQLLQALRSRDDVILAFFLLAKLLSLPDTSISPSRPKTYLPRGSGSSTPAWHDLLGPVCDQAVGVSVRDYPDTLPSLFWLVRLFAPIMGGRELTTKDIRLFSQTAREDMRRNPARWANVACHIVTCMYSILCRLRRDAAGAEETKSPFGMDAHSAAGPGTNYATVYKRTFHLMKDTMSLVLGTEMGVSSEVVLAPLQVALITLEGISHNPRELSVLAGVFPMKEIAPHLNFLGGGHGATTATI